MKICMIQLGRIGDLILGTPAFKLIKDKYPDAELTVIVGRRNKMIANNDPNVDDVLLYEKTPLKIAKFILQLKKRKFDYYIDPKDHFSNESKYIASIVNADIKIHYTADSDFTTKNINDDICHFTDLFIYPLRHLNIDLPSQTPLPYLYDNQNSYEYLSDFLRRNNINDYYVLNISASMNRKMWQNNKWVTFINKNDFDKPIILIYAPTERDRAEHILSGTNKLFDFKSRNFYDGISLIKNSSLLITPDTAMVHVAAAFNKPLLALYSGMNHFYKKFEPLSEVKEIIRAAINDESIHSIELEEVTTAFLKIKEQINL